MEPHNGRFYFEDLRRSSPPVLPLFFDFSKAAERGAFHEESSLCKTDAGSLSFWVKSAHSSMIVIAQRSDLGSYWRGTTVAPGRLVPASHPLARRAPPCDLATRIEHRPCTTRISVTSRGLPSEVIRRRTPLLIVDRSCSEPHVPPAICSRRSHHFLDFSQSVLC